MISHNGNMVAPALFVKALPLQPNVLLKTT